MKRHGRPAGRTTLSSDIKSKDAKDLREVWIAFAIVATLSIGYFVWFEFIR